MCSSDLSKVEPQKPVEQNKVNLEKIKTDQQAALRRLHALEKLNKMAAKTYTITSSNNVVSITTSDGVLERSAQKNGLVVNEIDTEYIQILDCGVEIFRQKYSSISDIGGGGAPASQEAARTALVTLLAPDAVDRKSTRLNSSH